jgi:hypothetical protein
VLQELEHVYLDAGLAQGKCHVVDADLRDSAIERHDEHPELCRRIIDGGDDGVDGCFASCGVKEVCLEVSKGGWSESRQLRFQIGDGAGMVRRVSLSGWSGPRSG